MTDDDDNATGPSSASAEQGAFGARAERPAPPAGPHVARAGRYFRNVRYIIFLAAFLAGLYFLYDGFVDWPHEQREYRRLQAEITAAQEKGEPFEHLRSEQAELHDRSDSDILIQRVLGLTLPPLALLLLIRWLYISRGQIRLDEMDTLHVPGHGPIPASAVTHVDDALWDRKGIAYLEYEAPGGETGRVRLDDFVYERPPTDAIHDRL